MDIPSFLLDRALAGSLITVAGQSILVSLIGITIIMLISGKSAPVRSLACAAVILAMGFVAATSIGLRLSGISWSLATIPVSGETGRADSRVSFTIDNDLPSIPMSPVFLAQPALADDMDVTLSTPATVSHSRLVILPASFFINFLGFVWLIGILFQLSKLGYGVLLVKNFRNTLKSNRNIPFNDMLRSVAGTFWKNRLPALYSSPLIDSPITVGLFKPVVIIPEKLLPALSENEFKSILLHELAHIYHYDQVVGVLKRMVIAIFWWNPFIYIINREHEQAREEVSDNYVLGELSPRVYIQCLMTLAEKVCLISNYPTAAGMAGRRFDLKVRVEQLLSKKRDLAIRTRSYFKTIAVSVCLALTFGIAGLHAHIAMEDISDTAEELHKTLVAIDPSVIFEETAFLNPTTTIDPEKTGKQASVNLNVIKTVKTATSNKVPLESYDPPSSMASDGTIAEDKYAKPDGLSTARTSGDNGLNNGSRDSIPSTRKKFIVEDVSNAAIHSSSSASRFHELDLSDTVVSDTKEPIETGSSSDAANQNRGSASSRQVNHVNPLPDSNKAREKKPDPAASCMDRGILYQRQGRIDDAISHYSKALELNPNNPDAYTIRGIAFCSKERYRKAIFDFNKAVHLDPLKAVAYIARGSAYFRLDRLSKAVSDFNKAIAINPDLAAAYQNRGSVYYHRGQFDNALLEYNKAIEKNPNLAASFIDRGNIYEQRGRIDDAISDYSRALELHPDDAETYINRGIVYYSQKKYQKAFVDFSKAIDLNPGFVSAYIYRGFFYQTKEEYDKALTDYSKALMLDPDDPVIKKMRNELDQAHNNVGLKNDLLNNTLKLVCRRVAPTGTRFKNSICTTKVEWNAAHYRGEELVRDIIHHSGFFNR